MKYAVVALILLASLLSASDKKRKDSDRLTVELTEAQARRVEDRIELDGTVKNAGDRPIEKLILKFEFLSSGYKVMTSRDAPISDEPLEAGDECEFHFQMRDEPRAVMFRVRADDRKADEPKVVRPGPYPIE